MAKEKKASTSSSSSGRKKKKKKKKKLKKEKESKKGKAEGSKKEDQEKTAVEKVAEDSEEEIFDGRRARTCGKKQPQSLFRGAGLENEERCSLTCFPASLKALEAEGSRQHFILGVHRAPRVDPGESGIFPPDLKSEACGGVVPRGPVSPDTGVHEGTIAHRCGRREDRRCLDGHRGGLLQALALLSAVGAILRGRAAAATDMLLQSVKSCESVFNGTRWTVAQRLEIVGHEATSVTPLRGLTSAQKEVYNESKRRQDNREWQPKGGGKDRRRGKNQGGKGEAGKKNRDGGAGKA